MHLSIFIYLVIM